MGRPSSYKSDLAAQLRADGETITRLTEERDAAREQIAATRVELGETQLILKSQDLRLTEFAAERDAALADRDQWREKFFTHENRFTDDYKQVADARDAALARVAELDAALKPYAQDNTGSMDDYLRAREVMKGAS